jgi:tetratricopeptide (TPR) repeat protein
MRWPVVFLSLLFLSITGWYCSRSESPDETETFRNLDPEVGYIGMQTCQSCHSNIHETYIETGMGQSFDRASKQKTAARFGDHALVYDSISNFYYFPYFEENSMYVLEFRLENGDTTHQRLEQIDYIIGSGHHTNSHIIENNGYYYQAPVTYYTQEQRWDLAPGYDEGANLRFGRYLTSECFTCHNHFPEPVPGSLNKYSTMPTGIECERCHGPGALHVKEKLAGETVDTSRFADYSIVNPRRLSRDLQMDLCQRCHLQGLAVLEPGKSFYDFRPGMPLAEVMQVYLPRYTDSHERFIMASQADRLRMSPCYLESEMTCITCHNPHHSVRKTDQSPRFNATCTNCHQSTEQPECSAPETDLAEVNHNCVHCHMPSSASIDIPHVSITDHYISKENTRYQRQTTADNTPAEFLGLQALTSKEPDNHDLARAYLEMYEKFVESSIMLDSAVVYLQQAGGPEGERFATWVQYYYLRKDFVSITNLPTPNIPVDAWTAYRLGEAHFQLGDGNLAEQYFRRAVEETPLFADFREKLGMAQALNNKTAEAITTFQEILAEDERRPVAHSNLGYLLLISGNAQQAEVHYDRAIALDPDYEGALLNKAGLLLNTGRTEEATRYLERILQINPDNEQVRRLLEG